jgi:hypothetical protein
MGKGEEGGKVEWQEKKKKRKKGKTDKRKRRELRKSGKIRERWKGSG